MTASVVYKHVKNWRRKSRVYVGKEKSQLTVPISKMEMESYFLLMVNQ